MGVTASCFWFMVCSQYFPQHLFRTKSPEQLFEERVCKLSEVRESSSQSLEWTGGRLQYHSRCDQALKSALRELIDKSQQQITEPDPPSRLTTSTRKEKQSHEPDLLLLSDIKAQLIQHFSADLQSHPLYRQLLDHHSHSLQAAQQIIQDLFRNLEKANLPHEIVYPEEVSGEVQGPALVHPRLALVSAVCQIRLTQAIGILADKLKGIRQQYKQYYPKFQHSPTLAIDSEPSSLLSGLFPEEKAFLDYLQSSAKYRSKQLQLYNKISVDDAKCQVCGDGDYNDDNLIVFCELCNISYHQRCYFINTIPEENWLCQLCKSFGGEGKLMSCLLCPQRGGCLRKSAIDSKNPIVRELNQQYAERASRCPANSYLNIQSYNSELISKHTYQYNQINAFTQEELERQPVPPEVWAHLTCATWTPETFLDQEGVIHGIQNIDRRRFYSVCEICKQEKAGVALQCADSQCNMCFHIQCAKRAGVYLQQKFQKSRFNVFCENHRPLKITELIEGRQKKFKEELQRFQKLLSRYSDSLKTKQHHKQSVKTKQEKQLQKKRRKQEQERDMVQFINSLLNYLKAPHGQFVIELQRTSENSFKVEEITLPKYEVLQGGFNRSDQIWEKFKFKDQRSSDLYRKWKKMMGEKGKLKQFWNIGFKKLRQKNALLALDDPFKQFCLCRGPYIAGEEMLECPDCQEWFHYECIGYLGTQQDATTLDWVCDRCLAGKSELERSEFNLKLGGLFGQKRRKYKQWLEL